MREKKLIRITLIVLFLSLFLIYVIFLQLQKTSPDPDPSSKPSNMPGGISGEFSPSTGGEQTATVPSTGEQQGSTVFNPYLTNPDTALTTGITIDVDDTNNPFAGGSQEKQEQFTNTSGEEESISIPSFTDDEEVDLGIDDQNPIAEQEDGIVKLPGTVPYFGEIDVTKFLGLEYEYILTDQTGVYYVYMGTGQVDYAQRAKKLSGSVHTIRTQVKIVENNLFGDVVKYINLPHITYDPKPTIQRKIVFMVVYIDNIHRIIQIPYQKYHKLKSYLYQLFVQKYPGVEYTQ